ncbi:MAG: hypothetical protein HQL32_00005, partial [Planctomycetes bacterium]|nr:hypothetical protein [Planctomycetota bacterium]
SAASSDAVSGDASTVPPDAVSGDTSTAPHEAMTNDASTSSPEAMPVDALSSPSENASSVDANTGAVHQASFLPSSKGLAQAFKDVQVEKTSEGNLRIEAKGESAQLLAGMFRGMAELFD